MAQLPGLPTWGEGWIASYLPRSTSGDVLRGDAGRGARWWGQLLEGIAGLSDGNLNQLQDRINRQVTEIGTSFRLPGEAQERPRPAVRHAAADRRRRVAGHRTRHRATGRSARDDPW